MNLEIEHKYLVTSDAWRPLATGETHIVQGYFNKAEGYGVRVRIMDGCQAFLTLKGSTQFAGLARLEFEYEIPVADAKAMMTNFCGSRLVEKTRYFVPYQGFAWEIDVFAGQNTGLLVAEIEIPKVDTEYQVPPWVGDDVTGQKKYRNASLARNPFSQWQCQDDSP